MDVNKPCSLLCYEEFELQHLHSPTISSCSARDSSPSPSSDCTNAYDEDSYEYLDGTQLPSLSNSNSSAPHCAPSLHKIDDDELTMAFLTSKQGYYAPSRSYASELHRFPRLCECRKNGVRWMIKAHVALNFNPLTVSLAVNYMDRYLEKNLSPGWKDWMMELLAVACLSVAAKMEEVDVPTLLNLQLFDGGGANVFHPKTVQRMELNVLSTLGWRLRSITAFTFLEKGIQRLLEHLSQPLKCSLMSRASEVLLASLAAVEFLFFEPSVVALTSISCALDEIYPTVSHILNSLPFTYITALDEKTLRDCCVLMESLVVEPSGPTLVSRVLAKSRLSPVSVLYHSHNYKGESNTPIIDIEEMSINPKRQKTS